MSVGIKAGGSPKKDIINMPAKPSSSFGPVDRSLRKTVTLDLHGSRNNDDRGELTVSGASVDQFDKLNSSVQTTDFLEVVQDNEGKTRLETRHPTVI